MITRLNYTDRQTLTAKMVRITVHDDVEPRWFEAKWEFDGKVPPHAKVYVEATSSGSPFTMRFPFGTVADPKPPESTKLTEITGRNITFTVKVVDETEHIGRLLGLADGLRQTGAG